MLRQLAALLALFQLALQSYAVGLLAIDYGSDSFKASYVGPGVPFDVLYNKDSKRKTPSIVTLHGSDVLVGGDASALATRFPKETFASVKMLLGGSEHDPLVHAHQGLFNNHFTSPKTELDTQSDRLTLYKPDGTSYAPEEILALQLSTAKDMAIHAAKGDKSFDAVITVPAFFNQNQRQAILDAAELAELRVLSLVNDGSAAAVNYAMTRTFPAAPAKPEYHMIFDAGASSIRATILSFEAIKVKDPASIKPKDATQLTVKGLGWSNAVGGFELDHRLSKILASQFKQDVSKNDRALAKFLKEASRVKHVLSANTAAPARIENILPDVDFKGSVTREEFQAACADLEDAFAAPITQALSSANMSMGDLDSVILVGGASRVPMIQQAVKRVVPEAKIAQNLNADEAAVMGAVLYGAGLSSQFKAKDIRVQDLSPHTVELSYEGAKSAEDGSPRLIRSDIFRQDSKLDARKIMPFKKSSDFELNFAYKTESGLVPILQAEISGFEKALTNLSEAEVQNATVKVTIEQTTSNTIAVPQAIFELPERSDEQGVAGKLWNMMAGSKDTASESASAEGASEQKPGSVKAAEKRPLTVSIKQPGVLSEAQKDSAKRRLRELQQAEARKKLREEARNVLEAYTYRARDLVEQIEFKAFAAESELAKIKEQLENTASWIWDEGETAAIKELRQKRTDLEKLVSAVTTRATEANIRPTLVSALQVVLQQAQTFYNSAIADMSAELSAGEIARHTQAELDHLQDLMKSSKEWLEAGLHKQKSLAQYVDPVLKKMDLEGKAKALTAEVEKLSKKKKPRASSSSKTSSASSETSSPTSSADQEESTDKPPRDEL